MFYCSIEEFELSRTRKCKAETRSSPVGRVHCGEIQRCRPQIALKLEPSVERRARWPQTIPRDRHRAESTMRCKASRQLTAAENTASAALRRTEDKCAGSVPVKFANNSATVASATATIAPAIDGGDSNGLFIGTHFLRGVVRKSARIQNLPRICSCSDPQTLGINLFQLIDHSFPCEELQGPRAIMSPHGLAARRVREQFRQCPCQILGASLGNAQAAIIIDDPANSARVGHHHRKTAAHGLRNRHAEGFAVRRKTIDVRNAKSLESLLSGLAAEKVYLLCAP